MIAPTLTPDALDGLLRQSYAGPAWHGPSVRATLRGIGARDALRRPLARRHCVWELVLHLAYGRYRVLGRLARAGLSAAESPRFPRKLARAWWPALPTPDAAALDAAWRADLALLAEAQRRLLDAVAAADARTLAARRAGSRWTFAEEIAGLALHDTYHAGQIRLLHLAGAPR